MASYRKCACGVRIGYKNAQCRACYVASHPRNEEPSYVEQVLAHYGRSCACCAATACVLTVDHVAGDGKKHRAELRDARGVSLYRWLVKQGFPDGFQVLCRECNTSKGRGFTCALHDYKFLGPEALRFYFE